MLSVWDGHDFGALRWDLVGSQLKTVIPSLLDSINCSEVVPLELVLGGAEVWQLSASSRTEHSPCGTTLKMVRVQSLHQCRPQRLRS